MTLMQYRSSTHTPAVSSEEDTFKRTLIDENLTDVHILSENQKHILRECYVQKNSVESAAYKLGITKIEAEMWYYRFSMLFVRNALSSM